MKISVSQQQGRVPVTVFVVEGEITADTAGPLLDEARKAVGAGTTNLLLDLSAVPYIASFGIRALSDMLRLLHSTATDQSQADLRQALRDGRAKSRHLKLHGCVMGAGGRPRRAPDAAADGQHHLPAPAGRWE
jgi:anti-anti-sigma regulatory factor